MPTKKLRLELLSPSIQYSVVKPAMSLKAPTPATSEKKKLLKAYWETSTRGIIMLSQDWLSSEQLPPLYLHPSKTALDQLSRAPAFYFGLQSGYFVEDEVLHFLFCPSHYPWLAWKEEAVYLAGDFNDWDPKASGEKWQLFPEEHGGHTYLILRTPFKGKLKKACAGFKFMTEQGVWLDVPAEAPNRTFDSFGNPNYEYSPTRTGLHIFTFEIPQGQTLLGEEKILWSTSIHKETLSICYNDLLLNLKSDYYLGAVVEKDHTRFRIFAPRALWVELTYYKDLKNPQPETLRLNRLDETTWEAIVPLNLHGYYYYYNIEGITEDEFSHFTSSFKILDPYAMAAVSGAGPGIIIDRHFLHKPEDHFQPPSWHDLVIVEAHVRDLIAKAPIPLNDEERLGFTGLEKWVRAEGSYLRELGVNALELQPIQEFDNQSLQEYHWGYMTCNYFSPASAYGLQPEKASQVSEFQSLVKACHDNGLAVILDVVYNHVGEPNHLLHIDKYHYFETNDEGYLMNFSGCGNDLRASAPMTRRLIIDSLEHLVRTYNVDGFRFDLAELIGQEVLMDIEKALKAIKPSIILIAEPWSFRGHIGYQMRETGFASWNDSYREFIYDYVRGHGNHEGFAYFINGSLGHLSTFPAQSVNYTASHDDLCWLDKITEAPNNDGTLFSANDVRRTHLMFSMLLSSLGIPMLAQGVDMLHSKQGVNNTYQRGDLNELDYGRLVSNSGTHAYARAWIRFRLSERGRLLRLSETPSEGYLEITHADGASASAVLYNADKSQGESQILYAINPHTWSVTLDNISARSHNFIQLADHERFDERGLEVSLMPWVGSQIAMPPLSCALFVSR